eukprot:9082038-Pyramimonas_sp.AAC.1
MCREGSCVTPGQRFPRRSSLSRPPAAPQAPPQTPPGTQQVCPSCNHHGGCAAQCERCAHPAALTRAEAGASPHNPVTELKSFPWPHPTTL